MDDQERTGGEDPAARRGTEGMLFDLARKAVGTSVKSLLTTEEGLRALVGAIVPKEVGQTVRGELSQLRKEFLDALVREMTRFVDRIDPATELQKVLSGLTFDVHVTVGISRKEPAARPGSAAPAAGDAAEAPRPARPARKAAKRRR